MLSLALTDMAEGRGCSQCSMKEVARTATLCVREIKAAKRSGEWSREEKKALKKEVKTSFKEIKKEVKQTWKNKN